MAESIGDFLTNKFVQGVEELRAANSGELASGPPVEAPQADLAQKSFEAEMAAYAQAPAQDMSQGMER